MPASRARVYGGGEGVLLGLATPFPASPPPFLQMESLFGSLPEMLEFQKVFLETLEDGVSASSDFSVLETPSQFRVSLFGFAFKANTSG